MMRLKPNVKPFSGRMDVVPLLNVIFLLLLFFVISSSFVFQAGIPVELPRAVAASLNPTEKLVITITRSDLLFFNDKPVNWDELERELREVVLINKMAMAKRTSAQNATNSRIRALPPMVVLRADRNVPYAKVIDVMGLARSLNLGVYLATDYQPRETAFSSAATPGHGTTP